MSLVDYGESDTSSESEEYEAEVSTTAPRQVAHGSGSGLLSRLPAAKFGVEIALPSAKGKARIALPTAPDSDSDDDGAPPKKKLSAQALTGQGSGLMALLPQPKNTFQKAKLNVPVATSGASTSTLSTLDASRAANPNMPSEKKVGRALVPHTLTKKKTDPPANDKSKAKAAVTTSVASASRTKSANEEEEDFGDGAFFSFEAASVSQMLLKDDNCGVKDSCVSSGGDVGGTENVQAADATKVTYPTVYIATDRTIQQSDMAEPATAAYTAYADATYGPATEPLAESGDSCSSPTVYNQMPSNAPSSSADLQSLLSNEEFKRLSRGGKRGRKDLAAELSNIVDFDENERATSYTSLPQKYLTEEKAVRMPKGQQPSRMTKSKHQITYLAYQAKEREMELKNQWSQNRLTKRQTQARYGF